MKVLKIIIKYLPLMSFFVVNSVMAINKAATFETFLFHQSGNYTIDGASDKGSITLSGVGARVGGLFGHFYVGTEGQIGFSEMKTDLSPDTVNRNIHPRAKTYDAIGGTIGLQLGRLQIYGTYFFDEKLNYMDTIAADGINPEQEYTYNYMGEGQKVTIGFNVASGLNIGAAYHKAYLNRYREKYKPESSSNKNTSFMPRSPLKFETFEVYLSWRFATGKFVSVK